jgi:hypothetical protein
MNPKMEFTIAATNDVPNVIRYDAITRGLNAADQNCSSDIDVARSNKAAKGINTIRLR